MMGSGGGTIHRRQKMASGTLGRALCGSRDYRIHLNVHSVEPSIAQVSISERNKVRQVISYFRRRSYPIDMKVSN